MSSLKRENILFHLSISDTKSWIVDDLWNQYLNKQVMQWIGEQFIPNYRYSIFPSYRKQMITMWDVFQKWLPENSFDFCNIDPNLLTQFSKYLPSLGWSSSAAQFIELVLLFARRYFIRHNIAKGTDSLNKKYSLKDLFLGTTVSDYRAIRNFFLSHGNDFEIVYFELFSMGMDLENAPIFGKDIVFKGNYAHITRNSSSGSKVFPCPKSVSKQLLKLLRSRNILAQESVFLGSGKRAIVNERKLKKQIVSFCEAANIPVFAADILPTTYKAFIMALVHREDFTFEDVKALFYLGENPNISLEKLELLDNIYNQLTNDKFYFEPSYDPSFLLNIMFPNGSPQNEQNTEDKQTKKNGRKVGYARGKGEKLKKQLKALKEAGCDLIFVDEE